MKQDAEMGLADHLMELRRRVILALLGTVVGVTICGIYYRELMTALVSPYMAAYADLVASAPKEATPPSPPAATTPDKRLDQLEKRLAAIESPGSFPPVEGEAPRADRFPPPRLIQGSPLASYSVLIKLCIYMGLILASPWVIYQIWAFIGVGLLPHERRFAYKYGPASFLLFIGGAALFYFLLLPRFLAALMSPALDVVVMGVRLIDPSLFLNDYFTFVGVTMLVFGAAFQTPLVVLFLARTGIVPLRTLARQQRFVILIMVVVAAIITPTVDPISMAVMALPLILLYEIGLLLAWMAERASRRREAADLDNPHGEDLG